MKKSKAFYEAQISVLRDEELTFEEKLEILAVLMESRSEANCIEKMEGRVVEAV